MALNPYQTELENLANAKGLKGAAQQQIYNSPEYWQLVQRMFGDIPLPAGINESMVGSRTPGALSYTDPEGYIHQLIRNLNGVDPRLGQVSESSTNRPSVLPLDKTNPLIGSILGTGGTSNPQATTNQNGSLLQQLINTFSNPVQLSSLDSRTKELLATMKMAEDQALQEQFDRAQGTAVAQLVGNGVGASSIAGTILSQLLQGQGLVRNQVQGQQAQRELGVQQFLTQGQQGQNQDMAQFVLNLLGQGTQRDISGAGLDVQREGMKQQNDQFFAGLQEQIRQFQEQLRMQERQSLWNNIFKGAAIAVAPFTGGLSSAFSGGAAPRGQGSYPTIGTYPG